VNEGCIFHLNQTTTIQVKLRLLNFGKMLVLLKNGRNLVFEPLEIPLDFIFVQADVFVQRLVLVPFVRGLQGDQLTLRLH
jgi:hypothetical protein